MLLRTRRLGFLLLIASAPAQAQSRPLPPLSFLGFEAGAHLNAVGEQVHALGGKGLHCRRATRDRSVQECRATVVDPGSRRMVDLWLSAMDSSAGILTLSSPLSGVELDAWRDSLVRAFGIVDANVQGPQWALQWVRAGRMLRLTWRIENGAKQASVSLVDGRVLDGWGRRRDDRLAQPRRVGADSVTAPSPAPASSP
jgi:hypothetical protein